MKRKGSASLRPRECSVSSFRSIVSTMKFESKNPVVSRGHESSPDSMQRTQRIEIGTPPYHAILETENQIHPLARPHYIVKKSPFFGEKGSAEFSPARFRAADTVWREIINTHPDDISILKAWARDVESASSISRMWGDQQDLAQASAFSESVETYLRSSGILIQGDARQKDVWRVTPSGHEADHPLNRLAQILQRFNVPVVISDNRIGASGLFDRRTNTLSISINGLLGDNYEGLLGTVYHEIIHAIFFTMPALSNELIPFRAGESVF